MADLIISGDDVADFVVTMRPGLVMSGRMTFESASGAAPQNVTSMRVTMSPVPNNDGMPAASRTANINADGTFTLDGILPGRYRLLAGGVSLARIGGPPGTWMLTSATVRGQDVSDRVFEIGADDVLQNVVLRWSDRPAEVSGRVLDAAGQPTTDYTVVLFTIDKAFWGQQGRRTVRFPPGPNGQFRFMGLLPGEYYICAVSDVSAEDFADPAFFQQLIDASLKIHVDEGEKKAQDLRLARQ